jgi:hypothetical protein
MTNRCITTLLIKEFKRIARRLTSLLGIVLAISVSTFAGCQEKGATRT